MFLDTVEAGGSVKTHATAEELGITQNVLDALLWVRNGLASGELVYDPSIKGPMKNGFNMAVWDHPKYACGTVRCIGGWMEARLRGGISIYEEDCRCMKQTLSLISLFCPNCTRNWSIITPGQAVRAIDNFTTNSPRDANWASIIGKSRSSSVHRY